jgi:hypothetical protein
MLKLFYVGGEVDWDEGMAQSNESFLTANTHSRSFDLAPTMKSARTQVFHQFFGLGYPASLPNLSIID